MSKPVISFAEFAQAVADEDEDRFVWSDLGRFDYDAPKARCALVSWCAAQVDGYGERVSPHWRIVRAGDGASWAALHDHGVLCFGLPPWRRSQVVRVVGRLGSVEAFVKALPAPSEDFVYSFDWQEPVKPAPIVRKAGGPSSRVRVTKAGVERRFRRRTRGDGQGELF